MSAIARRPATVTPVASQAIAPRPLKTETERDESRWHDAIAAFKRRLLVGALVREGGNRTRAARALGLQRTYVLRLIRTLGVATPR